VFLLPLLAVVVQALSGAPVDALQAPPGTKAIVFLFTSTDCPISNRYAPEVRRIADAFGPKGVVFRLVYPNPAEDAKAIHEHMAAYAYEGAFGAVRDSKQALVKFAGNYHGHSDGLLAQAGTAMASLGLPASAGVTPGPVADTRVVPYNEVPVLDDGVAAVIVEPIAANMGVVLPKDGFLK
jgi:hypothetical protein